MKHTNDSILIAKDLIAIPTVTEDRDACNRGLTYVQSKLSEYTVRSFEKDNRRSLLFSNRPATVNSFHILLNAHIDVVGAKQFQFTPVIKQNRLYGRGALDMKSQVACFISLFSQLASRISYPLGLQIVTDEEIGGFCGTKHQIQQGVKASFVICGETTDLAINNESKGVITAKINAQGKTGHSAYQWEAENALGKMVSFLEKLKKRYPEMKKESWRTSINIARIETANKTFNTVPDDCTCCLDIRYIQKDKDQVIEHIRSLMPAGMTMDILLNESAHMVDTTNKFVGMLRNNIQKFSQVKKLIVKKHGASDARHFTQAGISSILFGPGGYGIHSDDEYVDLGSLKTFETILRSFLIECEDIYEKP